MEIKRIIKEYYEQLYAYKFDNLDGKDQSLERRNLPKFTQGETDDLNMPISIKEIELIIIFKKRKCPFMYLLVICIFSLDKCLFKPLPIFFNITVLFDISLNRIYF